MTGVPPAGAAPPPRWPAPAELLVHHVDRATLVPLVHETAPGAPLPFRIGAFGPDDLPVAAAIHRRGGHAANPPPFAAAEEDWDGDFIYGGQLWDHFGHFLLESLSRAWAFATLPGPVLWQRAVSHSRLLPWQRDILDLLGLGAREHRVIDRPVRVARLAVPEQGLVTRRYLHAWQEAALAAHPCRTPQPGHCVWLSRSDLPARLARVDGEAEVEAALAADRWTILHPETMSLADQLAALEAAEVIAGFEGSAFHSLLLVRDVRARIVIFGRGPRINPNYQVIAHAKGLDQRLVSLDLEHLGGKGRVASYRLSRPAQVLDVLREMTMATEAAPRQ
ncbi:glycosyltransferase 61 family protein [Roseomonas sp. CAU 1739]|uniref:glycosyltransferase 61 family protein n=1 Tax=Roseomonas sp. CAU 1739 TaxID=3140364 RepID=UPI00325A45B0